ncbi:hypothetical protein [Thomasclavelia spiroformis]|uniref:hypothetical protein n=1 Tax=Thomasclavelia spiroformis TaxID=29348 RepID=UPI00320B7A53
MEKNLLLIFHGDKDNQRKINAYTFNDIIIDEYEIYIKNSFLYDLIFKSNKVYFDDKNAFYDCLQELKDYFNQINNKFQDFKESDFKKGEIKRNKNKIVSLDSLEKEGQLINTVGLDAVKDILTDKNIESLYSITVNNKVEPVVYSYHTYIFPFRIIDKSPQIKTRNQDFSRYNTREILESKIKISNHGWQKCENYNSKSDITKEKVKDETGRGNDIYQLRYNEVQYFNEAPLRAIFGFSDDDSSTDDTKRVVTNYVFKHDLIHEKAILTIQINTYQGPKEYRLVLNDIKLKLFNTDVAMMIFECENRRYKNIEDIKLINEYVRRICTPNLSVDSNPCAYYWEISFSEDGKDVKLFDDCYQELFCEDENNRFQNISTTKIFDPIKDLLVYPKGSEEGFILSSSISKFNDNGKKLFLIEPVIDDRMFVCSFIINDDIVKASATKYVEIDGKYINEKNAIDLEKEEKTIFSNYKYGYQARYDVAKELYSILYIDPSDSSCQSMNEIQTLLERDLYTRWIDYNTIYAITHHSFVALSTKTCPDHLINTFLTLYVDMTILALIQRATIIVYQNYASLLTKGIERDSETIKQNKINTLLNLHEKYIGFQNQLLFFEVSPEEQGMELYQMLVSSLYINEEKEALANQFQSLYDVSNANQDSMFNMVAGIVAAIALIFALTTFMYDSFDPSSLCRYILFSISFVVIILLFICIRKNYKRSK